MAPPAATPVAPPPAAPTFGSGRFVVDDGSTFVGEFSAREGVKLRHGKGHFAGPHFSYDGEWRDDVMQGEGTYVSASGGAYAGAFDHGAFHGQGRYRWPDSAVYEGSWVRNVMHGDGRYVSPVGVIFTGAFFQGCFVAGNTHVAVR